MSEFSDMSCYFGNLLPSLCIQWGWLWRRSLVVLVGYISLHIKLMINLYTVFILEYHLSLDFCAVVVPGYFPRARIIIAP